MTDALVVEKKSGTDVGLEPAKKKIPAGVMALWQEEANEVLGGDLTDIVTCIMDNIRAKHLPSLSLLVKLAERSTRREAVPERDYISLAEVLWKEFKELRGTGLALEGMTIAEEDLGAGGGGGELDSEVEF